MADEKITEREPDLAVPDQVPVLPLRDTVLFPQSILPLAAGRPSSLHLIEDAARTGQLIGVFTQRDPATEDPQGADLHRIGTLAAIHKVLKQPDGTVRLVVQGLVRIRLVEVAQVRPYLRARVEEPAEALPPAGDLETEALVRNASTLFRQIVALSPLLPDELASVIQNVSEPGRLADLIAASLPALATTVKQELLETTDVKARVARLAAALTKEAEVLELGSKIQSQVESEVGKSQREFYLREQLKAIQKELGQTDDRAQELDELRQKIDAAGMTEEARKEALRELDRLAKMPPAAAEYTVARTYLDWLVALPWNKETTDHLDIVQARLVLDEDHWGLDKVKDRILEYLAVKKMRPAGKDPILCFVGPPGVGKTSLGQSIARTLGRRFMRLSVGGVRDEAEIRGHRRTYIGAMPGTIIRSLRDAESKNPVLLIDEIDKMGADFRGDPASAMLEVLDPEQNNKFRDHYLDLPFDLSKVLFICTANQLETIPGPLLDRMDVIQLSGYTEDEKLGIARKYLVPKQLEAHGLGEEQVAIPDDVLRVLAREYTREAGVRNLERRIADLCRKAAREIAEGKAEAVEVDEATARSWLGPRRFPADPRKRTADPGVATGLAYTPVGGDVLFIEATAYPGKGHLTITGQLGDVMQESAQAALSWVRAHSEKLGVPENWFAEHDVHIHVPAGAVPKDGPSAGITIATAIASLVRGKPVAEDVGMTGEITLTGQVLPIGGLKEKALAAQRAGLKRVVMPRENEPDLEELPPEARKELEFLAVDSIEEVLDVVFAEGGGARPKAAPPAERQAALPA